ncbi:MAG: hypothetical protein JWO46_2225 [Nocardioidaceae bacterium]|nr:hypothetical protein [Nocardioidaceae bacterium]
MTDAAPSAAPPSEQQVRDRVESVAAALNDRLADITASMRAVLSGRIEELGADSLLVDLLGSSIEGNVDNILHALRHGIPVENVEPPSAANEYARRLAQRGVPVNALVRAYRLGQQHLLEAAYAECDRQITQPLLRSAAYQQIVTVTFDYIDWISQRVVTVYESEREAWLTQRDTVRVGRVEDLVSGVEDDVDAAEAVIGYRLRVPHLGVVLWVHETGAQQDQLNRFNRVATGVSDKLGSGRHPLVVPRDRASVWAWIPVPDGFTLDLSAVRPLLDDAAGPPLPMVAFGGVHVGVAGFRQTHLEALQAQRVAMIRDDPTHPVTGFQEPGLSIAALLALDIDETRRWVQDTLGELAIDDEPHARLRDTLLLFLRHDGSYTAAAEVMLMHKNSVRYRVVSAEKVLGRRLNEDRQAIEVALTACHWLGRAVLAAPRAT